jgi:hypothetical protein
MWHVFERYWFRPPLSTSVNWLSASPSDLYSRMINMNTDYSLGFPEISASYPQYFLRDFGTASSHKPLPIHLHHFINSFGSTPYKLGYYRCLAIIQTYDLLFDVNRQISVSMERQQRTMLVQEASWVHSPFPRVYRGMGKLADLPTQ